MDAVPPARTACHPRVPDQAERAPDDAELTDEVSNRARGTSMCHCGNVPVSFTRRGPDRRRELEPTGNSGSWTRCRACSAAAPTCGARTIARGVIHSVDPSMCVSTST